MATREGATGASESGERQASVTVTCPGCGEGIVGESEQERDAVWEDHRESCAWWKNGYEAEWSDGYLVLRSG